MYERMQHEQTDTDTAAASASGELKWSYHCCICTYYISIECCNAIVIPALHAKHLYVRHATACCCSTLSLTVVVANDVVTLR